jgi:hypothetical protein
MEGISDIKIVGIDQNRPPMIRKEPYLNLYFKLSHKAPPSWCDAFNHLVSKKKYTTRIEPGEGLYIETWLRKPDEITVVLDELKATVKLCSEEYIARLQAEMRAAAASGSGEIKDEGEQGRLNRIIAGLNFDD